MKKPTYLLLGWKPETRDPAMKFAKPSDHLPGELPVLAAGDAKTVIRAACDSTFGVLLFEIPQK